MKREEKAKLKLLQYFDHMKDCIMTNCEEGRHIAAICGSIGRLDTQGARDIFKEWLDANKIKYEGNL